MTPAGAPHTPAVLSARAGIASKKAYEKMIKEWVEQKDRLCELEAAAPASPVLTQAPPAPLELPAGNGEWLDIARALAGSMADQAALICERLEAARNARAIAAPGVEKLLARIGDCYCALEDLRHMVAEAKEAAGDTEKGGSHA